MSIKDTLRKATGLFFELEPESNEPNAPRIQPKTVEQILIDTPGPNLDEIKAPASPETPSVPSEPVLGADGHVNFSSIYKRASLPETPLTAEQVIELLASLPSELPIDAKRTTLKVTIDALSKSTGASIQSVVADTTRKLAALDNFHDDYGKGADQYVQLAQKEIANLEAQIAGKKSGIEDAIKKKQTVTEACTAEAERLDDVLEFFSSDNPPSSHAT